MSSATEELRRLLDERGVEWFESANTLGCVFTRWYSPLFGDEVVAMENGEEGLVVFDHYLTPEQAVEATLGPREQPPHDQLQAENAKLRELVDELYPLADYGAMDASELDRAHDLMRELGIEVDE